MMKRFLIFILTLIIASNFFCGETLAKTDEEKAAKKDEKLLKKREKKIDKAAKKNDFQKVIARAEGGDVQAQIILAYAYWTGQRTKKHFDKSAEWKEKAFAQDEYLTENFIPKKYGKKKIKLAELYGLAAHHAHFKNRFDDSVFWAEMGAAENNRLSLAYLGAAYYTGRGVGQDYKMAIDFLKRAGDEPLALKLLSDAYEKGNGVEKDLKKSKIYFDYLNLLKQKNAKKNR